MTAKPLSCRNGFSDHRECGVLTLAPAGLADKKCLKTPANASACKLLLGPPNDLYIQAQLFWVS